MGMDAATGKPLTGWEHTAQSIRDILTTPIGSRVMRRTYGSKLHELIDSPQVQSVFVDCVMAIAEALYLWEPRFDVTRVSINPNESGTAEVVLEGFYRPEGLQRTLEVQV